jgi:hypothetical protein
MRMGRARRRREVGRTSGEEVAAIRAGGEVRARLGSEIRRRNAELRVRQELRFVEFGTAAAGSGVFAVASQANGDLDRSVYEGPGLVGNIVRTPVGAVPRVPPLMIDGHHDSARGVMRLVPRTQHTPGSLFLVLHPGCASTRFTGTKAQPAAARTPCRCSAWSER